MKNFYGFGPQQLFHRDFTAPLRQAEFLVNQIVVELNPRGVLPRVGVINLPQPRPVNRRQAHRARLATDVDRAIRQSKRLQFCAGVANGGNFGVRCRVMGRSHPVPAAADDASVADDHRSERAAFVAAHFLPRKADRRAHEFGFVFGHAGNFLE